MRVQYRRDAPSKLERGRASLEKLSRRQDVLQATQDLALLFHAFAGSGRTYGFPRVSTLGHSGEMLIAELATGDPNDAPPRLARCRRLLDELGTELSHDAVPDPGQSEEQPQGAPEPLASGPPAAPRSTVLLIGHDPAVRAAFRQALEAEALRVIEADSLRAAEAALAERLPDGLLAEVVLPDGESFGLVERLRALEGGDELPVVLASSRGALGDRLEAIHCGADAYFSMPIEPGVVVRRLRYLLDRERFAAPRVLSVEDDPEQATYLRAVVESAGYTFEWCPHPARFESALAGFRPDLVLMDVLLPGVKGYDLARTMRLEETYAFVPVVFLTTQSHVQDRLATTRAGGTDHLLKPVAPEVLLTNIAARLEQARFLRSLIDRDGLTGLLTHSALFDRAGALMAQARRRGASASWIMIDVDLFKSVNVRHGHAVGDRVLQALAALLRRRLRQSDVLGRYGGEEFAAVLADLDPQDAHALIDRLREEFARVRHEAGDGTSFTVTFSAGVAALPGSGKVGDWCERADRCLYEAKLAGRNRVVAVD